MIASFTVCVGWKLAGEPFGLGATVPDALACAAALVFVGLATCKQAPTPFLDPYKETEAAEPEQTCICNPILESQSV